MDRYVWIVMGLNFVVDLLLLAAVYQLTDKPFLVWRCLVAAALGGIYGGVCLLPDFYFLGNGMWRLVCIALMSLVAFGMEVKAIGNGVLFCFLRLGLNGLAAISPGGNFWTWVLCLAVLFLLHLMGHDGGTKKAYVPVVIRYAGKTARLTAFRDTGNFLKDPVTGKDVLIADPMAARLLLGLDQEQLEKPVQTMELSQLRGLRLIPYNAIGHGGLLLAMRFTDVELDGKRMEQIVAFAPRQIGAGRGFQALVGGMA